jgi:hypothetical protein
MHVELATLMHAFGVATRLMYGHAGMASGAAQDTFQQTNARRSGHRDGALTVRLHQGLLTHHIKTLLFMHSAHVCAYACTCCYLNVDAPHHKHMNHERILHLSARDSVVLAHLYTASCAPCMFLVFVQLISCIEPPMIPLRIPHDLAPDPP